MRLLTTRAQVQLARRCRQLCTLWGTEGPLAIVDRVRRTAAEWIAPSGILPVRAIDVMAADLSRPFQPSLPQLRPGEPITVNWVTTPPSPGSGGHTTLFRIINYLQLCGYSSRVYFYDVYGGDHAYYESIVREYYAFKGPVASVDEGMKDAHAVVATSWPTAYAVFNSRCTGKRFYFVQDFEPYFYPVGSISFLAENTYHMGFHGISIGNCFVSKLRSEFNMTVESFEYGCDTSRYYRTEQQRRSGVVFYCRTDTPRRGSELGIMALQLFATKRPDIDVHIYGDSLSKLPFRFVNHGHVAPSQLNAIYNRCYAGLSLSFTNVSLVAQEMLAAGCIPVVNSTPEVRSDFANEFAKYVPADPHCLASALEEIVTRTDFESLSRAAANSVQSTTWEAAGATVDRIFRRRLSPDRSNAAPTDALMDVRS